MVKRSVRRKTSRRDLARSRTRRRTMARRSRKKSTKKSTKRSRKRSRKRSMNRSGMMRGGSDKPKQTITKSSFSLKNRLKSTKKIMAPAIKQEAQLAAQRATQEAKRVAIGGIGAGAAQNEPMGVQLTPLQTILDTAEDNPLYFRVYDVENVRSGTISLLDCVSRNQVDIHRDMATRTVDGKAEYDYDYDRVVHLFIEKGPLLPGEYIYQGINGTFENIDVRNSEWVNVLLNTTAKRIRISVDPGPSTPTTMDDIVTLAVSILSNYYCNVTVEYPQVGHSTGSPGIQLVTNDNHGRSRNGANYHLGMQILEFICNGDAPEFSEDVRSFVPELLNGDILLNFVGCMFHISMDKDQVPIKRLISVIGELIGKDYRTYTRETYVRSSFMYIQPCFAALILHIADIFKGPIVTSFVGGHLVTSVGPPAGAGAGAGVARTAEGARDDMTAEGPAAVLTALELEELVERSLRPHVGDSYTYHGTIDWKGIVTDVVVNERGVVAAVKFETNLDGLSKNKTIPYSDRDFIKLVNTVVPDGLPKLHISI